MFTGIVEELGTVKALRKGAASAVIEVEASTVLQGTKLGDSIATNGVCLTVTGLTPTSFTADVMHETLNRSSLGALRPGSKVNLERAMALGGRFGGHIVSGHIDGCGTIERIEADDNAVWYTIGAEPQLLRYIVEKGSVTLDGISLTVAAVDERSFKVSVIPHTREVTNLRTKSTRSTINIETDILGKYVEKLLSPAPQPQQQITLEQLAALGF
ncbi:MAG: riboflavin synthase [Coriobacteriales bacterium]